MSEDTMTDGDVYPVISVVVPVYNTEHTLRRCVDSIIAQTYKQIEIILIDDGSTDQSGQICDKFMQQDKRVKVIHKENGGLANARKVGVSVATGKFVGFVDSDDYIDVNTYNCMYLLSDNGTADLVGCGCIVETGEGKIYQNVNLAAAGLYEGKNLVELKSCMLFDTQRGAPAVFQSACCKLFRKKLLKKVIEGIDERITIGEDAAIVYPFLLKTKKIVLSNDCFYHYVIHDDSMTHSRNISIFERIYFFQNYMREYFREYDESYELERQLNRYLLHLIDMGTTNIYGIRHKQVRGIRSNSFLGEGKIILYGAGTVGKRYYLDILEKKEIKIVSWIDKKLAGEEIYYRKIQEPESIKGSDFDYVLIAVADRKMADEIKEELKEFCDYEKLVWFPGGFQYNGDVEFLSEE